MGLDGTPKGPLHQILACSPLTASLEEPGRSSPFTVDLGLQAQFGVGNGGHSKVGAVLFANELRVGIPSGRHCECKGLEAGKQVTWWKVSEEKSLTEEQGFSQLPPIYSLFHSPHYSPIPTRKTFTP